MRPHPRDEVVGGGVSVLGEVQGNSGELGSASTLLEDDLVVGWYVAVREQEEEERVEEEEEEDKDEGERRRRKRREK